MSIENGPNLISEALGETPEPETPEPETAVDEQGYTYNILTGEVISHPSAPETFRIDSAEAVDWALGLRSEFEGDLVAIKARRQAVNRNFDRLEAKVSGRLKWWDWRFRAEVVGFARSILGGKKDSSRTAGDTPRENTREKPQEKTVRFAYGFVSFRITRGTNDIFDMDAAVKFVAAHEPGEVRRVETVTVKGVKKAAKRYEEDLARRAPVGAFMSSTEPVENVTIETGVGKVKVGSGVQELHDEPRILQDSDGEDS